ncbi:HEAT repeat domain-containing protein [Nodularia sp. LEGE 04288]|uniref:HEAT repeat domain-containing protein n=1 Tax=Nodularia sp. LEGE 04288 TaxID=1828639 RepID=UPI001D0F731B|nr:HEAT repeat domain-containing protein [Nodularia sp. LEGE 04288]MCC2693046.1 HEAT repeat domain-containing protein [Nodularia sp. LEGE 04288]
MGETRNRNSVGVNAKGKEKLQEAKAAKRDYDGNLWTDLDIATEAGVSEKTVERFFSGTTVSKKSAIAIAKALNLELTDLIDEIPTTPPPETTTTLINWREVCNKMLEPQRRITSNLLMQDESAKKERKQIYVPLALVERKKPEKRNKEDFLPDAGTRLYEPEYETQQRFEHEAFFSQILEQGEGKTKGKQIAVIGEPGAGKTTLLQTVAFWVLDKYLGLPIWISLADLARNGNFTDIQTYIDQNWLQQAILPTQLTQEVRDDLTNQIQQGRVWLLLDGVDEISAGSASQQPLEEISRQLTGWVGRSSRVVLTCRLNVWQADRNALETFETYRLLDFDYPQQVHQFIDNWFVEDIEKGERLKTELNSTERVRLRDLVQTPLRLTLLCSMWQSEEGNLPETKAGLYSQCVQQFYTWKQNRFPTQKKEKRELNQALGSLALRDINEGSSRFRLRESFISEELGYPDDETSLFYQALQLGWLNHVGIAAESPSQEKVYAFYHATFEEYFAALAVEDWDYFLNHVPENPEQGTYRIFEPQWKEVILLWLGREDIKKEQKKEEQKKEFIQALVEFEDGCKSQSQIPDWKGFYEYRAYFLAAAGIAEFKDCGLADAIVQQIVRWGFGYLNIKAQNARAVLIETDHKKAITALEELIRDSQDEYIRRQAADRLGKIAPHNPTAITALVELIRDSQDEDTRWQAAFFLENIAPHNPTVITALVELIRDSQDEDTRWQAAQILEKIAPNNPTVITALVELIRDSQDEDTRWQVALILEKIAPNNPTVITALVELIRDSQSEYTRMQAASTLGKIAANNPTAITALVELIRDSQSEYTRMQAASTLGKIAANNPTAVTALKELIRDSQDKWTRMQAAESLGKIAPNNPTVITALEELIRDSQSEDTRWQAAFILGKIAPNDPTLITVLVELIHDSQSEDTRRQAALILENIAPNNPTAITALEELIRDSQDKWTRMQAAESLGKIAPNNPTAITALVELIRDSQSEDIRMQAALILGKIAPNNPTAITALVELIHDSQSEDTRRQAALILEKIAPNNPTAITALEELIRDSQSKYTRWQAAEILGKIAPNNPTAITALVELIRDSQSEDTRWQAAESLGKIAPNNPTAITALVELIRDSQSEYIRRLAAESLRNIAPNNPTAITALVELIRDSQSEDIRRLAAESLRKLLTEAENMAAVVTTLKNHLSNEAYKVIWHCAQTMTYPAFYQAWHS